MYNYNIAPENHIIEETSRNPMAARCGGGAQMLPSVHVVNEYQIQTIHLLKW